MLTEDDKKRIEAEEAYRAQMRDQQGPVKTESFMDRYTRWSFRLGCLGVLLMLGMCTLMSLGKN